MARCGIQTRRSVCNRDSGLIRPKPWISSLGGTKKVNNIPGINQGLLADIRRSFQDTGGRLLRCRLGEQQTSALNFGVFVPFWLRHDLLEFQEAIHHCFVEYGSRVYSTNARSQGGVVVAEFCG